MNRATRRNRRNASESLFRTKKRRAYPQTSDDVPCERRAERRTGRPSVNVEVGCAFLLTVQDVNRPNRPRQQSNRKMRLET